MKRKKAKEKIKPQDGGLNPKQRMQLRQAIRQVWSWSYARRLCIARATRKDGFAQCENPSCKQIVAKVFADHVNPCGTLDEKFIEKVFCPSTGLQALCNKCHAKKTREERKALANAEITEDDF